MKGRTENTVDRGKQGRAPINRAVPAFRIDPKDPNGAGRHEPFDVHPLSLRIHTRCSRSQPILEEPDPCRKSGRQRVVRTRNDFGHGHREYPTIVPKDRMPNQDRYFSLFTNLDSRTIKDTNLGYSQLEAESMREASDRFRALA